MNLGPLSIQRLNGSPLTYQGRQITPQHLVVQVGIPFLQGGLVFNRAIAIRVEEPDHPPRVLPILNYTRLGQMIVFGLVAFASSIFLFGRKS